MTSSLNFGRVAVAVGGDSVERPVSLRGGAAVCAALTAEGVDAFTVDGLPALQEAINAGKVDRVFNLIHGKDGEDGVIQGMLDALGVPYTGTGLLGAALSMDKARSKQIWMQMGLKTAGFQLVTSVGELHEAAAEIGYPIVVKPTAGGSSFGVSMVSDDEGLASAFELASEFGSTVMAEEFVSGKEYTVGILGGQPLPVVRIEPDREFYDYEAKYEDDATQYFCPSGLPDEIETELKMTALVAFDAVACSGWGRVDFIGSAEDGIYLLEVNTTPGMTGHSLVPKAAAALGIEFNALILEILATSLSEVPA